MPARFRSSAGHLEMISYRRGERFRTSMSWSFVS